ncbi:hypothetical protein ASD11_02955 [Aeromicrobium sp. Root495]|uniref:MerR family transcriptional regulator n=1 Tax=Aeromicrobium sp. Root495 TaxID=1736550 RepID=UPI0006F3A540|nr:MerR family transcriptional regulator [Aeromicrobium sp. Root495]KQY58630.1 hypothetical protein ASD11_02955 [Aeromicrobium sp. Root495]
MSAQPPEVEEFTVDQLAARADMTVRNVRAYASRGLLDPPRLEGRTGYYTLEHLQRLQLVRELVDRGYTLAAVEQAITASPRSAAGHTLDLLHLLEEPNHEVEPEVTTRDALAALASVPRDDALIDSLAEYGLVEWIDDDHDHVRLMQPQVVRSGAAAVSLGLDPSTIIAIFPAVQHHLRAVADDFVSRVAADVVNPFVAQGLPEDGWDQVIRAIESLLPVASQVTLGIFRTELSQRIETEIHSQLGDVFDRLVNPPSDEQ